MAAREQATDATFLAVGTTRKQVGEQLLAALQLEQAEAQLAVADEAELGNRMGGGEGEDDEDEEEYDEEEQEEEDDDDDDDECPCGLSDDEYAVELEGSWFEDERGHRYACSAPSVVQRCVFTNVPCDAELAALNATLGAMPEPTNDELRGGGGSSSSDDEESGGDAGDGTQLLCPRALVAGLFHRDWSETGVTRVGMSAVHHAFEAHMVRAFRGARLLECFQAAAPDAAAAAAMSRYAGHSTLPMRTGGKKLKKNGKGENGAAAAAYVPAVRRASRMGDSALDVAIPGAIIVGWARRAGWKGAIDRHIFAGRLTFVCNDLAAEFMYRLWERATTFAQLSQRMEIHVDDVLHALEACGEPKLYGFDSPRVRLRGKLVSWAELRTISLAKARVPEHGGDKYCWIDFLHQMDFHGLYREMSEEDLDDGCDYQTWVQDLEAEEVRSLLASGGRYSVEEAEQGDERAMEAAGVADEEHDRGAVGRLLANAARSIAIAPVAVAAPVAAAAPAADAGAGAGASAGAADVKLGTPAATSGASSSQNSNPQGGSSGKKRALAEKEGLVGSDGDGDENPTKRLRFENDLLREQLAKLRPAVVDLTAGDDGTSGASGGASSSSPSSSSSSSSSSSALAQVHAAHNVKAEAVEDMHDEGQNYAQFIDLQQSKIDRLMKLAERAGADRAAIEVAIA
jgi:hypothetical protein